MRRKYSQQHSNRRGAAGRRADHPKATAADKSVIPIFSSPEPELVHSSTTSSGRESSLSHTSSESATNPESEAPPTTAAAFSGGKAAAGYLGRSANRQDLHSHLWRGGEEKYKHKSQGIHSSSSNIPKLSDSMGSFGTLSNDNTAKHTTDITLQMSKPLPTEPIRRVDLGFSHKPLEKSMRFHRGQECYIKKVPQAIVAPFRRNPPESSSAVSTAVTPIHRASIASAAGFAPPSLPQPVNTLSQTPTPSLTPPAPVPALVEQAEKELKLLCPERRNKQDNS